jgi:hypothetical protein
MLVCILLAVATEIIALKVLRGAVIHSLFMCFLHKCIILIHNGEAMSCYLSVCFIHESTGKISVRSGIRSVYQKLSGKFSFGSYHLIITSV